MIKIEVTGDSIPEVADKLLALGANLRGSAIIEAGRAAVNAMAAMQPADNADREGMVQSVSGTDPVMPEVAAAPKKTRRKATDPVPSGNETVADTATGTGSTTDTEDAAPAVAEEPTEATPASPAIDFTVHVMPAVLKAVEDHGREAVEGVLTTFGVTRASQLAEGQWGEFLDSLKDIG